MDISMTYEEKVKNKCHALLKLVIGFQEFYSRTNEDNQRFIETTIGAAIWYLPKNHQILFTGKISKDAIRKGERSEDHLYPRKIAARKILEAQWEDERDSVETLSKLYIERYGRFNYFSKSGNKKLIKFQKSEVFSNPETAYGNAGVELVDFDDI